MSGKDYRVLVKVKNANLLRAIEKAGYKTVGGFCRAHGISQSLLGKLVNLQDAPTNQQGEWRPLVVQVSVVLNVMPSDLFSEEQHTPLERNSSSRDVSLEEISSLVIGSNDPLALLEEQDDKVTIDAALLGSLTDVQREIINLRFGLDGEHLTLHEIGERFDISSERIRQLEANALRKLRGNKQFISYLKDIVTTMNKREMEQPQ